MRLSREQANVIDDWYNDITDSGSIFDDILGDDGHEIRFFCATPKEMQTPLFPDFYPYCVLTFDPFKGFTFVHWYYDQIQAALDNVDFPYGGN